MSLAASAGVTAQRAERTALSAAKGSGLVILKKEELSAAFPVSGLPTTKGTFLLNVTPPGWHEAFLAVGVW